MLTTAFCMILAVLLDWRLGEPRRWHPLVGFGRMASGIESLVYAPARGRGVLAWGLAVVPLVVLSWALAQIPLFGTVFSVWALYFALGHKSLHDHLLPVVNALQSGDEATARALVSRVVSRDSAALEIAPAACETALENGNDGIFGALFWFAVAGAPGAILYRLANTLDAMWGYRNARYLAFGWMAARTDDVLNYIPARLTALTYALLGNTRLALHSWRTQAPLWDSPNAGPVMSAGAGALALSLGGPARYEGEWHERPPLGAGAMAQSQDIDRALRLVRHGVALWLVSVSVLALLGFLHA